MNVRWQVVAAVVMLLPACSDDDPTEPTTGGLAITVTTTGSLPDPDGYTFSIDGAIGVAIGANGTFTQSELAPGDHLVAVSGIAGNCSVGGDNPRTASVTAGDTLAVAFEVTCTAPPCGIQSAAAVAGRKSEWSLLTPSQPTPVMGCARRAPEPRV